MERPCPGVRTSCTNQASSRSPGSDTGSPLHALPPFPFPPQEAVWPPSLAVSFDMRTPEGDPFARNETASLHSDDTPQKRDQPRPGVNPDLTPTPPTSAILTPAPRTSDQDGGEWEEPVYSRYDES